MAPTFPFKTGQTVSAMFFDRGTVLGNATIDRIEKRERDGYRVHVTIHNPGSAKPQQSYIVSDWGKSDYLLPRPVQQHD